MRIAILCALSLVLLAGCPKERRALDASRKAVELSAETLAVVDAEYGRVYAEKAAVALEQCETRGCYRDRMRGLDKGVRAVDTAKLSLLAIQSSLDAWEAGSPNGQTNFRRAAGCFLHTLVGLQHLLVELGVNMPNLETTIQIGIDMLGFDPSTDLCGVPA